MKTNFTRFLLLNQAGAADGGGGGAPAPGATGTPAPGATGATGTPAPQNTPAPAPTDWTSGLNPEYQNFVSTKGFKDPQAVLESYRNLEKLMGAPKERLLTLPENDDPKSWASIYDRLGRPAKAEEYTGEFPDEAGGKELTEFLKAQFHESGLTKKQGENLIAKYLEHHGNQIKGHEAEMQQTLKNEEAALKKEWGAAHQKNINIAANAARQFGLGQEQIDAIESALGYSGVMKLLHNIGSKIGEGSFVKGDNNNGGGALTPEMAKAKIAELSKDSAHAKKLLDGDIATKSEWDRLHTFAYPEQKE